MGTALIIGPFSEWDMSVGMHESAQAEIELEQIGIRPKNPFGVLYLTKNSFGIYIHRATEYLKDSTCIYLLKGWEQSGRCQAVIDIATDLQMDIIYQQAYHDSLKKMEI